MAKSATPHFPNAGISMRAACSYESTRIPSGCSTWAATTRTLIDTRPPKPMPTKATIRLGITSESSHFSSTAPEE